MHLISILFSRNGFCLNLDHGCNGKYKFKSMTHRLWLNKNHQVFWYLTFAVDQVWIWEVDRSIWKVFWQVELQEVQSFIIGISTMIHILAKRDNCSIVLVGSNPESLQEFSIACYFIELHNKMSFFPNGLLKMGTRMSHTCGMCNEFWLTRPVWRERKSPDFLDKCKFFTNTHVLHQRAFFTKILRQHSLTETYPSLSNLNVPYRKALTTECRNVWSTDTRKH